MMYTRTGERVVLGEDGEGPGELLEEVVVALGHLLHVGLGPLVRGQLMVHDQQPLVVQDVPVVVVVEYHGRPPVIPHVLHRLRVGDWVWALVEHVGDVVWVQGRVHLRVQPVDQLHAVGSAHTVCSYIFTVGR